jgi:hypothetical protein
MSAVIKLTLTPTYPDLSVAIGDQSIELLLTPVLRGPGVADGGTTHQALRKASDDPFDTEWHTLAKADVGLDQVDNTSDADKPVSTAQATAIAVVQADVDSHEADTANPHQVTKAQVGLGSVDNTADSAKPVSTAQAAADAQVLVDAKAYTDAAVVGLYDPRGNYDASGNVFPSSGGSGAAGAVVQGDIWRISVAGTLGSEAVGVGDEVVALVDSPGQTAANWNIYEHNLGYVPEPQQTAASQAEAEAGTGTSIRSWTPLRIWQAIAAALTLGTWISGATGKATPVDGDSLALSDSAASGALKKLTWANLRATLKTYFDSLYQAALGYIASRGLTRTAVKTGAYNAVAGNLVPIDASSGNVPITLPDLSTLTGVASIRVGFKLIGVSGSFSATISAQGTDVFNKAASGVTAATLSLLNQAMVLEGDTSTKIWTIVSNDLPLSQMDARYGLKPAFVTVADAVTLTPALVTNDATRTQQVNTQAAGTLTLANPTGTPVDGQVLVVRIVSTNAQTLAYGTMYEQTATLSLPSATTGSNKLDEIGLRYFATAAKFYVAWVNFGA